jgi:hypothetical protein
MALAIPYCIFFIRGSCLCKYLKVLKLSKTCFDAHNKEAACSAAAMAAQHMHVRAGAMSGTIKGGTPQTIRTNTAKNSSMQGNKFSRISAEVICTLAFFFR